ncbi:hypothetical protein H5S40_04290 [Limosilactobacillus sp. RRLNB_1_1]|uniref:Uncharacterized protein n=1 Tax=Limosilactobacillus albertensis TaxID=2759752 RepID=A0A7W3TR72_9LACO|nr:hypothetical protein [Limosilactobacillus albertensis]MBB1069375.1 hypothetical protein [Limosilactobacillus albertensis]MCD7118593.1 hypothetical protein [Limosilactobacillus albertensis]MCD7128362.1 hypothetical protein [Limosilactobacillus albertensis]
MLFNNNKGYIGQSRSARSEKAIESNEVPLNQITRELINEVIDDLVAKEHVDETKEEWLRAVPVYVWKEQLPTSWHHTGKYFKKTDHYDLPLYAQEFLDDPSMVTNTIKDHKQMLSEQKQEQIATEQQYEIYYYEKDIWGGTRRHPKIVGTEYGYGVAKSSSSQLYPVVVEGDNYPNKSYYSLFGNYIKTTQYSSYLELIKDHREFKSTKLKLNKTLKSLNVTPLTLSQEKERFNKENEGAY